VFSYSRYSRNAREPGAPEIVAFQMSLFTGAAGFCPAQSWTCININDAWQGKRGGKFNALEGNEKFPDMKKLCDEIHALGLKAGIYSTPWVTSYANHAGGSAVVCAETSETEPRTNSSNQRAGPLRFWM
jgi:hypothetical protein